MKSVGDIHRRGITVTLTLVDETLCEVEQWAKGREIKSVLYKERNSLTEKQKQKMLSEIARMRRTLLAISDALGLEAEVCSAANDVRSKCSGLWEHVAELKAKHLKRYGDVPAELEDFLDPLADQLIEGLVHILDAIKIRRQTEPERKT